MTFFQRELLLNDVPLGFASVFIFSGSGSRFEAGDQSGSRALMTKNWRKKITAEKKFKFFFDQIYLQFTFP
jgi:hypothetical protein